MSVNCYFIRISLLILFPFTVVCVNQTSPANVSEKYTNLASSRANDKNGVTTPTSSTTVRQLIKSTLPVKIVNSDSEGNKKLDSIKKMNLIKGSKVKTTSAPDTNVETYRLNSIDDGTTCILMKVDAMITFLYTSKLNEPEESDTYVPGNVDVSGDCSNEESSTFSLKWKSYDLTFNFAKTPGGDRWFVNGVQLGFNTQESIFKHINHPNSVVRAQTAGDLLFVTPVGRSFKCHREIEINLITPQYPDIKVKLLLRELTVEPFLFKNDFGAEYLCSASGGGSFRSETAPFIFGSLLAVSSLFTVAGYSIYRYFKVNKVQYDTME